jgi:hypothetical protein
MNLALRALFAVAVFLVSPVFAQIDSGDVEVLHPNLRVAVPNLAAITTAHESSQSVAKAALAIVLSGSRVKCEPGSQLETVGDANAGSSLRTLASRLSGTSCMTESGLRWVSSTFTPNGAIQGDSVIASLIENKPLLVEWKGELYVLYSVVYDEHLHSEGSRVNVIRQLLLIDPRYSEGRRLVEFVREKDNLAEIAGLASIDMRP